MANNTTQQLESVGREADCSNLCATGRQLENIGQVRLQAVINDYCPFYAVQQQTDKLQFDANTFSALPDYIQARLSLPQDKEGKLDGVYNREQYILRSNLLFVAASPSSGTQTTGSTASNDVLVDPTLDLVKALWSGGKSTTGNSYVPHYAWTHTGSLFDTKVINPNDYYAATSKADNSTSASVSSSTYSSDDTDVTNLSKWRYETVNVPLGQGTPGVASNANAPTPTEAPPAPVVLFPMQGVSGTKTDVRGVHWSVQKRRPVYQGTDFFLIIRKSSPDSTILSHPKPLLSKYAFLDSNLGNASVNPASSTGPNQEIINAGMIEVDETGAIVDTSRSNYDFSGQVYFIIEIGQNDPDHNYFIILSQNNNPTCIHVSSKTNQLITSTTGTGVQVVSPKEKCSRRLSVYDGVSSDELLNQKELTVTVRNHFGRIVITFSGHEDNPWVIERKDLNSPTQGGSSSNSPSGSSQNSNAR